MPNKISQHISLTVYEPAEVLPEVSSLIEKAKEAALRAYAPYSNFQVGAALLMENGEVVTGNNQENACYPAGLCAERVAFFAAKSKNPDLKVLKVAIVAKNASADFFKLATPCGSCRQVMSEYEFNQKQAITIYLSDEEGKIYESESVDNFLPFKFSSENL